VGAGDVRFVSAGDLKRKPEPSGSAEGRRTEARKEGGKGNMGTLKKRHTKHSGTTNRNVETGEEN